mgnify:CR=1 FL=1|tara:strand:+ start:185 stop:991 length:807 start_codon:yes stop_codon:yes gene_type:complete
MEDLNKQQLILLVLLVSFVTSIATGIITVSLLDKAPVEVTQTVNRVVERTVETVVPQDITPEEKVVTVRETVVVSQEDQVVESIEKNEKSVVRVESTGSSGFKTMGTAIDTNGKILVSGHNIERETIYEVTIQGQKFNAVVETIDVNSGIAYLLVQLPEGVTLTPATVSSQSPKLGQTVVVIGGEERNAISTGIISDLSTSVEGMITGIVTDIETNNMTNGSLLLNLSGDIIALYVPSKQVFVPVQSTHLSQGNEKKSTNTAAVGEAL